MKILHDRKVNRKFDKPEIYRKMLDQEERATIPAMKKAFPKDGHLCLIIGYNAATREIAFTDSWGKEFALEWVTEKEANEISQAASLVTLTYLPKSAGKGKHPRQ
jgi:hypothetical protein